MKRCWILLVGLIVLAGCTANDAKKEAGNKDGRAKVWAGSIRTDVPVLLWLTMSDKDSVLYGQVWYTNYPQPPFIMLAGKADTNLKFTEIDTAGNVTGYWDGKIKGDTIEGFWTSPKTGKKFLFAAGSKDTSLNVDLEFAAENIDGVYEYHLPNGGQGEINVKKLDDKHIVFNALCIAGNPGHDQATMNDDTATLNHGAYISEMRAHQCPVSLRFYKSLLLVGSVEDTFSCEWVRGADDMMGVYVKTSNTPAIGKKKGE